MNTKTRRKALLMATASLLLIAASTRSQADQTGTCGGQNTTIPFNDVLPSNPFFCAIAEAFFSGLTNGTTATTYSPSDPVPRQQMAAFVTRTLDQALKRGSRRAALRKSWTPTSENGLGLTTVGFVPKWVESDGADLWVPNQASGNVYRVRASDGKLLEIRAGNNPTGVLAAKGLIFVIDSNTAPGKLYQIDPTQPAGPVTTLPVSFGDNPSGIAFDGARIWTANRDGSISIVTLNPLSPTTVTTGFSSPEEFCMTGPTCGSQMSKVLSLSASYSSWPQTAPLVKP